MSKLNKDGPEQRSSHNKGVPEKGQESMLRRDNQEERRVEGREMVQKRNLEEKEKRKNEGQGEHNQVNTPSNTCPNEYVGDQPRDKVQEMWVDVSEGEGGQELDKRQRGNEVEENSTGEQGKNLEQKEVLKENVGTERKSRLA